MFVVSTTGQGDPPDSMKVGLGFRVEIWRLFGFQDAVVIGLVSVCSS